MLLLVGVVRGGEWHCEELPDSVLPRELARGSGAKPSPDRPSTWATASEPAVSHESLIKSCSVPKGCSKEDNAEGVNIELPPVAKAVLR